MNTAWPRASVRIPNPLYIPSDKRTSTTREARSGGQASPIVESGSLRVDTRRATVTRDGKPVSLSSLEYRALRYLLHNKGRPVSQGDLAEHVYGAEAEPDSNALEVLIGRLRKKVGPELIATRRGYGYLIPT